ncbi:EF-hand domain-containing protein [Sinorhizobium numidicum]|uniref:EF-hand domain-containing protein n=1 Tax=Sinorhizobium numidicum TaxID=680248 RepID=A0ABY8D844_9HYPH|nr:EF-hand domain-containing protein [Sinorhizobium numidicum]WEX79207.1 EF-hand domain-containing protein [Sinorhizobium numidicum]WEX85228.1 EF-hand domain-containing protein [Sinorhizobium numidicum]
MERLVLAAAFALSQVAFALAQDQSAAMYQGQMDHLDSNKNGAVDRSEYQAFMTTAFANLDKNKDGSLRSDEVAQVLNTQQFAATDANRDRKISQNEFMNRVMADFRTADRSGDGSLQ